MRLVLVAAVVLVAGAAAHALDTTTRPVGPILEWTATDLDRFDPAWLHVKFVEDSQVGLEGGRFVDAERRDLAAVNGLLAGALTMRRTFPGDPEMFRQWKRRGEAAYGRTGPDLSLWFDVQLPADRAGLAATLNALLARPEVEIAHPAPVCEPAVILSGDAKPLPPSPHLSTPDFTGQQQYLQATPIGLDAPSAWAQPGGRGENMRYIDVELGWTFNHEDFNLLRQFYAGGADNDPEYVPHGTAVMGEVVGMNNGFGVTGFASNAQWGTVAITAGEWPEIPHYFLEAIMALRPGDVWLIELQMYPPGRSATPMEWLQVNFDAIWTGCWALDVVCVEAGANGSQDLDAASWGGVFDRSVRDSGAIMVAAGTPTGRVAEWFTNYGSRMDVHAWGSSIVTTGYGDLFNGGSQARLYTAQFGGTSGASPMVTGAALSLQGIAKERHGQILTPIALRELLTETGIGHLDGSREIGPRPDIGAAVSWLLDVTSVAETTVASGLSLISARSPFGSGTEIAFSQPAGGAARLEVFDVAGRRIRSIDIDPAGPGARHVQWDGRDAHGNEVSSGVYIYRIEAGRQSITGRVVKVR